MSKLMNKLLVSTVDNISVCESINNECTAALGSLCKSVDRSYIISSPKGNINGDGDCDGDFPLADNQQNLLIIELIKC